MPGRSYSGAIQITDDERWLAERLRSHVLALASRERNTDLEAPARYIEQAFGSGATSQAFSSGGRTVRNIELGSGALVVGAHYDSVPGSPGADDNASGVAVLIELAAMLKGQPIAFIAFANEEEPYFMTEEMGSLASARRLRERGSDIQAMYSLEMLGCFSDSPGSQHYPAPFSLFYPDRGNFIGFVADLGARSLVRRSIGLFRKHAKLPSEGVAAPAFMPGVTWSDHWSFRRYGYPAVMVTDTAFHRYPHYHLPSDTPEKLDYERMALVTTGLAAMLKELVDEAR